MDEDEDYDITFVEAARRRKAKHTTLLQPARSVRLYRTDDTNRSRGVQPRLAKTLSLETWMTTRTCRRREDQDGGKHKRQEESDDTQPASNKSWKGWMPSNAVSATKAKAIE